jgi:uncharacterized lipoprotein YddW (UPF0748 family)
MKSDIIKAISIDINWDMFWRPASPGLYVHADPKAQVRWAHELGANVLQTFCNSYNGYAWFPSDVAPVTPGLRGNFLQDQVEEGHKLGMKVMGYFCLGANPYWAINHESHTWHDVRSDISSNESSGVIRQKHADHNWIPFTEDYLDYFCACVQDVLRKTDVDGFMIDWFKVERGPVWLDNEKQLWGELMGEAFPACGAPSAEAEIEFKRRQVERAWVRIREAVHAVRPAVIWTNQPFTQVDDPLWNGHRLLKEVDWLLNESPKTEFLDWLAANIGPHTKLLQNFCGWADHSAGNWRDLDTTRFGFYGFTSVNPGTGLPWTTEEVEAHRRPTMWPTILDRFAADARNTAILREAYHSI